MRIRTMASQGRGDAQPPEIHSSARQDSIYSLALSELQSYQGDPLHTMNFDELLKNVSSAKPIPNPSLMTGGAGSSSRHSTAMPHSLNKKTVDEVWRDIQQGKKEKNREQVTLEDFLVKAGIQGSDTIMINQVGSSGFVPNVHWLQQYHCHLQQQQQQQSHQQLQPSVVVGAGSTLDAMYGDNQGNASSPVAAAASDPQTPGRKRVAAEEIMEKTVERRQKRMIKNRESAARSRARKQAYTNELENKISLLEEENERLRKQKELISEIHVPQPEPKYKLSRMRSAPF